ncbi:PilN domain-containing protein [Hyphomicrobium sp. 99]|uniref:PilN domain-containing protein n=1 Tax=Hyphomicrobium sp. 99 TaxID=1163419 RepID=UPI0005F7A021|nr:PilN domain-containing protein [Hyphomicrobium sp. 99]
MLASISDPLSRFFTWWGSELTGILSPAPVVASDNPNLYTVAVLESGGYRLIEPRKPRTSSNIANEAALSLSEILSLVASVGRANRSATIGIRVPQRACFVRNVTLPGAAARDFPVLLSLDLERTTPFKQKDVYTAHTVDPSRSGGGRQSLRQYIIKRSLVDGLKSDIEALGLKVTSLECIDAAGAIAPINFLEVPSGRDASLRMKLLLGLASCAVVLAAAGAYIDVSRHEAALELLQSETARLKDEAQSVRDMTAKYQTTASAIASFNQLRRETVSRVAILEELTRLLPDSAWVSDVKISGATVDISGLATSASAIVPILEKSPLFVDATSTSALTFDPLQDKERFGIRVRLRNVAEEVEKAGEEAQ